MIIIFLPFCFKQNSLILFSPFTQLSTFFFFYRSESSLCPPSLNLLQIDGLDSMCIYTTTVEPRYMVNLVVKKKNYPTTNCGMQNGSSVGICTHCTHAFCTFGADLHAHSVLNNKISASKLSRTFIKTALLVGYRARSCSKLLM